MTDVEPTPGEPAPVEPLLSVSKGNPTAEELAAVTAVVLALKSAAQSAAKPTLAGAWARRAHLHLPLKPGVGAWRRSSGR